MSRCRSQYRAGRSDGTWRITRITSVYERDTLTPTVPGTTLDLDPEVFARYRPSYRCLAWHLGQDGTEVAPDLLGADRPAAVAELYATERAWLNAQPTTLSAAPLLPTTPLISTTPIVKEH